jgi:hypothetical protein
MASINTPGDSDVQLNLQVTDEVKASCMPLHSLYLTFYDNGRVG